MGPFLRDTHQGRPGDERFPLLVQDLVWNDANECATHQGAALGRADQLLPRNREHKFQQAAVQIGITLLEWRFEWQSGTLQLPSESIHHAYVVLEAREGTEQLRPGGIACKRGPVPLHIVGLQPRNRPHVFRDANEPGRKESPRRFPEQMEPWLSFFQRPYFQLMSEPPELCSCEKIFEFRCRCRHATHSLVATHAGEHDAIPLRG